MAALSFVIYNVHGGAERRYVFLLGFQQDVGNTDCFKDEPVSYTRSIIKIQVVLDTGTPSN